MLSKSFYATNLESLENTLTDLRADGFKPTLGIVFSTVELELKALTSTFLKQKIDLIGCTSSGEISNTETFDNAITGLLFDLDRAHFRVYLSASDDRTTYQSSFEAGQFARSCFENPAMLVLSGGIQIDGESLVFGLKDGVGREIPLFGALAGDNLKLQKTWAFTHDSMTDDGQACIVFDNDEIELTGMATSGWQAIGNPHTITKADGNLVYEINGRPALEVFLKHFGYFDNSINVDDAMSKISAQYPLQFQRGEGIHVLRTPLFADREIGSLTLGGGVRVGEQFRFSISPGFQVIEQTIHEYDDLRGRVEKPDAVILFSCKGRHAALGPLIEDEIEGLYNHWNAPMAGFFSYGEIGNPRGGVTEFHNETCSLVLLKSKN